jgi:hypothetical protein
MAPGALLEVVAWRADMWRTRCQGLVSWPVEPVADRHEGGVGAPADVRLLSGPSLTGGPGRQVLAVPEVIHRTRFTWWR